MRRIEDINENEPGFEPGIQGREDYFNSVVMVLLIWSKNRYHFVFQQRSARIRQGGEICFPGGKCDEADPSPLYTALRETEEELGIRPDRVRIIGKLDTVIAPMGAIIDSYVGVVDFSELNDSQFNPKEVEQVFTIPVDELMDQTPERHSVLIRIHPTVTDSERGATEILLPAEQLGLSATYTKPWGNFRYPVYVYKTEHGIIWGITARLILAFRDRWGIIAERLQR